MVFNSIPFIMLFPLAALIFYLVPVKFRYIWLLLLSYAFYFAGAGTFVILLAAYSIITYIAAHAVSVADQKKLRKALLALFAVISVLLLFVFKYLDFTLSLVGSPLRFSLVMPLGISFFTFTAVSYIADVYHRRIEPEANILKLALYLSFFPSILSGPINRAGDLIPQFSGEKFPSLENIKTGMQKMLWGYFLKLAVAGRLAIAVDNVYSDPGSHSGFSVAFAAAAYLFMLYCDFEGYSQIAVGCSSILGIKLKENFRQPFFSLSMSEIWRRWHVSLSSWFRDYIYIPLGGSRRGVVRKYVNIFIVLAISGIWHGANMTFVIWGVLNGIFIIAGQMLLPYRERATAKLKNRICRTGKGMVIFDAVRNTLRRVGVYMLSALTFVFFANDSVSSAISAVSAVFRRFSFSDAGDLTSVGLGRFNLCLALFMAVFVLASDLAAYRRDTDTPSLIKRIPAVWRWIIYYALITAVLFSANLTGREFIYSKM